MDLGRNKIANVLGPYNTAGPARFMFRSAAHSTRNFLGAAA